MLLPQQQTYCLFVLVVTEFNFPSYYVANTYRQQFSPPTLTWLRWIMLNDILSKQSYCLLNNDHDTHQTPTIKNLLSLSTIHYTTTHPHHKQLFLPARISYTSALPIPRGSNVCSESHRTLVVRTSSLLRWARLTSSVFS